MARSCAKKNCGAESEIGLPVRTSRAFMPRLSLPEQTRMKAMRSRWFGSMFAWILNTKPVMRGSVGSTRRLSASWPRGGGATLARPSMRSRTPKLRSAEPKKTGVRWPSRNASRSNGLRPPSASSTSSRHASAAPFSVSSSSNSGSSGPDTATIPASSAASSRRTRLPPSS